MKYGVLYHRYTKNLGDDIQAYASSRFLPQIDYMVDREELDTFTSENNEAVSVIMSAWMFRKKWNWPPAPNILPLFVGMHMIRKTIGGKASPLVDEGFEGLGGDYLRSYGPVGCRDKPTEKSFKNISIDSFFSGCITLTLPEFEKTKPEKEYICLIDLPKNVEKKIKDQLKDEDIEIRNYTHINRDPNNQFHEMTWEERAKNVEERLKIYQNAKCVVTIRLHATLPCLAMGVPVLWIPLNPKWARFDPYRDWVECVSPEDFMDDKYNFDFMNPAPNLGKHQETRENLIDIIENFIDKNKIKILLKILKRQVLLKKSEKNSNLT
ncbi:polysaccharide pyruvyl transferase family protein [Methanobrevibacter arboriphilus]|uniref:polysaccharide pyruvyl transferase family protein n=1 Tax=Methanobrevibacter arboriphilus TaxID=39441 RepID=UPI0005B2948D|nr:polysaccharide pyruvyl transferase family protein [Methanobrevibacter arboriphilus]